MAKPSTKTAAKTTRKPATKATKAPAPDPTPEVVDPTTLWPKTEDDAFTFVRAAIAEDQKRRKGQTYDANVIDNFTAWAKAGRPNGKGKGTSSGGGGRVSITDDALDVIVRKYVDADPMCRPSDIFEGIRADGGKVGDKRTIASYLRVRRAMGLPDRPTKAPAPAPKAPAPPKAGPKAKASKAPAKGAAKPSGKAPVNPNGKAGRRAATKARVEAQASQGSRSTAAARSTKRTARKVVR